MLTNTDSESKSVNNKQYIIYIYINYQFTIFAITKKTTNNNLQLKKTEILNFLNNIAKSTII